MSAPNDSATLRFSCPACRAELAVPATLAGIEGPCPSCCHTIRAPLASLPPAPPAVEPLTPAAWQGSNGPILPGPTWPPAPAPAATARRQENLLASLPEALVMPRPSQQRNSVDSDSLMNLESSAAAGSSFRPRRAIPPPEEPQDDSWKDRHLKQQRSSRRVRRAERAAHNLLQSRGFRIARVALILLSGAMLAFLFHYLQTHQWRFPGMSPAVADETPRVPAGKVRPVGGDVNELMADDDTEIPPASDAMPSSTGAVKIAAPPP